MSKEEEQEILDVVDAMDRVVGKMNRKEIHAKKLPHRSVHIFVFDHSGRLYLQLRSWNKTDHPGKWDSSAAGHVDTGETYLDAAHRELREELGLRSASLTPIIKIPESEKTGREHVILYRVLLAEKGEAPLPNPQEIQEGRFFKPDVIERELVKNPDKFTASFHMLFRRFQEIYSPAARHSKLT